MAQLIILREGLAFTELFLLLGLLALYWQQERKAAFAAKAHGAGASGILRAVLLGEDEDIKIASLPQKEWKDAGERSAREFEMHRENGDLDKARLFGKQLAELLLAEVNRTDGCTCEQHHQLLVLYSYGVNKIIQLLPNSMIAQLSLSDFYDEVKRQNPAICDLIQDSVSFTFYILEDRTLERNFGEAFAKLCGEGKNQELEAFGNRKYQAFYERCRRYLEQFAF